AAREAAVVRAGTHRHRELRRDDHLVAGGELPDEAAGDLLGCAEGVDVRGVEGRDARLDRLAEERAGIVEGEGPAVAASGRLAVRHAAEDDAGDVEAGGAEADVLHWAPVR